MGHTDLERTKDNRSEKKKTIILTVILSLFLIGGVGTWGYFALFGTSSTSEVDLPSEEEITNAEKSTGTAIYKPTIQVPVTEINHRINRMHEYWNSELGFGNWHNYKINSNLEELKSKVQETQQDILPYVSGPLKKDVETAINKIEAGYHEKNIDALKGAHRIFHDLDITLNDYKSTTDFWEVTETYKWWQKTQK
ncbi:hypothetical protein [Bacillus sp. NEB1478]|uniref:hypothetical protein n=1 Tax=Bacillus sp. NEB1478 TaxID=3073816 RepID=UPI002873DE67|nr:hypothetical protein [Bacillus sp. NEB1478]WNB92748.1 hypothetical protein RGB74_03485 [Bacillus sp. NEB1478]